MEFVVVIAGMMLLIIYLMSKRDFKQNTEDGGANIYAGCYKIWRPYKIYKMIFYMDRYNGINAHSTCL
jgi:hypothetical protein